MEGEEDTKKFVPPRGAMGMMPMFDPSAVKAKLKKTQSSYAVRSTEDDEGFSFLSSYILIILNKICNIANNIPQNKKRKNKSHLANHHHLVPRCQGWEWQ
jgi:hypothetical protein